MLPVPLVFTRRPRSTAVCRGRPVGRGPGPRTGSPGLPSLFHGTVTVRTGAPLGRGDGRARRLPDQSLDQRAVWLLLLPRLLPAAHAPPRHLLAAPATAQGVTARAAGAAAGPPRVDQAAHRAG